jgi:hypothetical protein
MQGGFIAVVLKNIPAAKDQIVKPGQRYKILDEWTIIIRALAQTNSAILGQGAYRSPQTFFNELYTRNNCGTHGSHTGEEYTQLPSGWRNRHLPLLHTHSPLVDRSMSSPHYNMRARQQASGGGIIEQVPQVCKQTLSYSVRQDTRKNEGVTCLARMVDHNM